MSNSSQSELDVKNSAVLLENVSKNYGPTLALVDISFAVNHGEIFGLLGPNGAGKTTTLRILKGMIKATSGTAWVMGHRLDKELNWVKQHTGYLPEEGGLLGRLTPLELCEFIGGLFGVPSANARERALEFLKIFDLLEKKDELVEKLSRGMKQKLSIICSIIHDPEVVLCDELLSSLDPSASKMVKDFIKYLSREKKKTIIISSHRLAMVQDICDRVAIIHQGTILKIGTPEGIMKETSTQSLEDAYLAVVPGYVKPIFSSNGSIVDLQEDSDASSADNTEERASAVGSDGNQKDNLFSRTDSGIISKTKQNEPLQEEQQNLEEETTGERVGEAEEES